MKGGRDGCAVNPATKDVPKKEHEIQNYVNYLLKKDV